VSINFNAHGYADWAGTTTIQITNGGTFAMWINPLAATGTDDAWGNLRWYNGTTQSRLILNRSGGALYAVFDDPAGYAFVSAGAMTANTWQHIAAVWNGSSLLSIYVNGLLINSVAAATSIATANINSLRVGQPTSPEVKATIQDVIYYSAGLSATEIAGLYAFRRPTRTADLFAWYPLFTGVGFGTDFSGNARTLGSAGTAGTADGTTDAPATWGPLVGTGVVDTVGTGNEGVFYSLAPSSATTQLAGTLNQVASYAATPVVATVQSTAAQAGYGITYEGRGVQRAANIGANLGINGWFDQLPDALIDMAVSLGIKWIRVGGPEWSTSKHPTEAAFIADVTAAGSSGHWPMMSSIITQIGKAHTAGLKVLCVAMGTPSWCRGANRTDGIGTPAHQAPLPSKRYAWVEYARQMALTGCDALEIINEPNAQTEYWLGPDHPRSAHQDERNDDYVILLQQVYTRIKGDVLTAGCTVLTCSLAPIGHEQLGASDGINHIQWAAKMFAATADDRTTPISAAGYFDAFNHHPYADMNNGYGPIDWTHRWVNQPGDAVYTHGVASTWRLRQILINAGQSDKKIWATEFGSATYGGSCVVLPCQAPITQSQWMRDYLTAWFGTEISGYVAPLSITWFGSFTGPAFIYQWRDQSDGFISPLDREGFMGIADYSGNEKLAAKVVHEVTNVGATDSAGDCWITGVGGPLNAFAALAGIATMHSAGAGGALAATGVLAAAATLQLAGAAADTVTAVLAGSAGVQSTGSGGVLAAAGVLAGVQASVQTNAAGALGAAGALDGAQASVQAAGVGGALTAAGTLDGAAVMQTAGVGGALAAAGALDGAAFGRTTGLGGELAAAGVLDGSPATLQVIAAGQLAASGALTGIHAVAQATGSGGPLAAAGALAGGALAHSTGTGGPLDSSRALDGTADVTTDGAFELDISFPLDGTAEMQIAAFGAFRDHITGPAQAFSLGFRR